MLTQKLNYSKKMNGNLRPGNNNSRQRNKTYNYTHRSPQPRSHTPEPHGHIPEELRLVRSLPTTPHDQQDDNMQEFEPWNEPSSMSDDEEMIFGFHPSNKYFQKQVKKENADRERERDRDRGFPKFPPYNDNTNNVMQQAANNNTNTKKKKKVKAKPKSRGGRNKASTIIPSVPQTRGRRNNGLYGTTATDGHTESGRAKRNLGRPQRPKRPRAAKSTVQPRYDSSRNRDRDRDRDRERERERNPRNKRPPAEHNDRHHDKKRSQSGATLAQHAEFVIKNRTHNNHLAQSDETFQNEQAKNRVQRQDRSAPFIGDVLMHNSSWDSLINGTQRSSSICGWRSVFGSLEPQTLRFWAANSNTKKTAAITIYLSEILGINSSIRSIDGEKFIIEVSVCGTKCVVAFPTIEQRQVWYRKLSDYHLNYFVWRTTPLDASKRRSQIVVAGVQKLLNGQRLSSNESFGILYVEDVLSALAEIPSNINERVPDHCRYMGGRLQRVLYSVRFFVMSALTSLSGADVPLPSTRSLIEYIHEVERVVWSKTTPELLDYLTDKCYRVLFNLSFAFTSACRDDIQKYREFIQSDDERALQANLSGLISAKDKQNAMNQRLEERNHMKMLSEMRFEYKSLQTSWKLHRERLQEYVMAYRDAVAKLKLSYHQRDSLCKKIENIQKDKVEMTKRFSYSMNQAKKLTKQFAKLSASMGSVPYSNEVLRDRSNNNNLNNPNNDNAENEPAARRLMNRSHSQAVPAQYPQSRQFRTMSSTPKQYARNQNNMTNNQKQMADLNIDDNGNNIEPGSAKQVLAQTQTQAQSNVLVQKLSLDLIRMRAERDTLKIMNPKDIEIVKIENEMRKIEKEIKSLNEKQFSLSPPLTAANQAIPSSMSATLNTTAVPNSNNYTLQTHFSMSQTTTSKPVVINANPLPIANVNVNNTGTNNNNNRRDSNSHSSGSGRNSGIIKSRNSGSLRNHHVKQMSLQLNQLEQDMNELVQSMEETSSSQRRTGHVLM